jgi:hypothetical protein
LLATQVALLERQADLLDEILRALIRMGEKIEMPL